MLHNFHLNPVELVVHSFTNPIYFDDHNRLHEAVYTLAHEEEYSSVEAACEFATDDDRMNGI